MNNIKSLIANCETCVTKPCQIGCPLNNDIPSFIKKIKEEKYEDAFNILLSTTILMPICGRVCPHEKQCEGACVKGITYSNVKIGAIESFIGDMWLDNNWKILSPIKTKHKVAIIGAGPSGLTCAAFLRRAGIGVTIYEKHRYLGGLLMHGIPEFRLPKQTVKKVVKKIINLGIEVKYNQELGKNITLQALKKEYDAIYLAIGANVANKIAIDGENLKGVYGANELLETNKKLDYKYKTVVVVGGGDVAMDVSRIIKRKGAKKVLVVYRRRKKDMPAKEKEINEAKQDGVEFLYNTNIIKILGEKNVTSVELVKTRLNKNKELVNIENSNKIIKANYVITAIGSHQAKVVDDLKLAKNNQGKIMIDVGCHTSDKKVFSGGDVAGSKSTVAWASRMGKIASSSIIEYLEEKSKGRKKI